MILRPPTVYGPRDRDNLITVFKAARLGIAPVFGDGSMEISVVHVEDLADAIVLAGTAGEDRPGRTYYVNHPEVVSSAELVRGIGRMMGRDVALLPIPEWAARVALTATGAWAAALRRKTILRADKANEFFQAAWTGDPAPFIATPGGQPRYDARRRPRPDARWYRERRMALSTTSPLAARRPDGGGLRPLRRGARGHALRPAWRSVDHRRAPRLARSSPGSSPAPPRAWSARRCAASYPVLLLAGLYSSIDIMNGFGARPPGTRRCRPRMPGSSAGSRVVIGGAPRRAPSGPRCCTASTSRTTSSSRCRSSSSSPQRRPDALERYLDGADRNLPALLRLTYLLVPVAGPYYEFARPTGAFVANGAAQLVYATLAKGSAFGAAFPSSHVAATVAATVGAWLGSRRLGMLLAVPTALLAVGVVYCQMHYVVDSAAGVALGAGACRCAMAQGQTQRGGARWAPPRVKQPRPLLTGR